MSGLNSNEACVFFSRPFTVFAMFGYVVLCCCCVVAMFCYVLQCFAMFCYVFVMFCYVLLCFAMICYDLLCFCYVFLCFAMFSGNLGDVMRCPGKVEKMSWTSPADVLNVSAKT